MTLEESFSVFGLNPDSSEEERRKAYSEVRRQLEDKRSTAPTQNLEKKYDGALSRLDEAIEMIELSLEVTAKPLFEDKNSSTPSGSLADAENRKHRRRLLVLPLIALLAISVLGIGIWQWKQRELREEQIRIQAELTLKAEREREAEIARLKKEQEENKLKIELDLKKARLEPVVAMLKNRLQEANTKLEDLKGTERITKEYGNADEKAVAHLRRTSFENYIEKLSRYINSVPAMVAFAKAESFEREGQLANAISAIEDVSIDQEKTEREIEKIEAEVYTNVIEKFIAEIAFAKAYKLVAVSEDFDEAINAIRPLSDDAHVGGEATKLIQDLLLQKRKHTFAKARELSELGEYEAARELLDTLSDDPIPAELDAEQEYLIMKLNAEYAYKQILATANEASARGSHEEAKELLAQLLDDPYVGKKASVEWEKLEAKAQEPESIVNGDWEREFEETQTKPTPKLADSPPKIISQVEPRYPDTLRHRSVEGFVELEWTVTTNGTADDIQAIKSSHREFEAPAIAALKQWKFEPRRKDGDTVATKVRQRMLFAP